jgi:hypothetical protein
MAELFILWWNCAFYEYKNCDTLTEATAEMLRLRNFFWLRIEEGEIIVVVVSHSSCQRHRVDR